MTICRAENGFRAQFQFRKYRCPSAAAAVRRPNPPLPLLPPRRRKFLQPSEMLAQRLGRARGTCGTGGRGRGKIQDLPGRVPVDTPSGARALMNGARQGGGRRLRACGPTTLVVVHNAMHGRAPELPIASAPTRWCGRKLCPCPWGLPVLAAKPPLPSGAEAERRLYFRNWN